MSTGEYVWRPLRVEDAQAVTELTNAVVAADSTGEPVSVDVVREALAAPSTDLERDSWSAWAGETLVARGFVRTDLPPQNDGLARALISGDVHPEHRGRGLGTTLMDHLERIGRAALTETHPGRASVLRSAPGLVGSGAERLLAARGYAPARYWLDMELPLAGHAVTPVPTPAGITLRHPVEDDEAAALAAHTAAFADHWGSGPQPPERWHDWWVSSLIRRDLSTLAIDADGQVVAYALSSARHAGRAELDLLGTIPRWRGRGLATALLSRTIGLMAQAEGVDVVDLVMDSDNPTSAPRLYEHAGFRTIRRTSTWDCPVGFPTS